jgi:hypothetical protein
LQSVRLLRSDQVGSLLRPPALLNARAAQQGGRLSEAELSQLEDAAILKALQAQAAAGQQIYVDGEFRRTGFMTGCVREEPKSSSYLDVLAQTMLYSNPDDTFRGRSHGYLPSRDTRHERLRT